MVAIGFDPATTPEKEAVKSLQEFVAAGIAFGAFMPWCGIYRIISSFWIS